jgi:hypothetical protein
MSECEKIIYYLDEITAKTGNKIKTILEYYNSLKINLIIMKGKLALDMLNWEEKMKSIIGEQIKFTTRAESERQIFIGDDELDIKTILVTFS